MQDIHVFFTNSYTMHVTNFETRNASYLRHLNFYLKTQDIHIMFQ
jgi:hypothetical protein